MLNNNNIKLVKGLPLHAEDVVKLLPATSPKIFNCVFKGRPEVHTRVAEACWKASDVEGSHSFSVVALDDDDVVGILIAYNWATFQNLKKSTTKLTVPLIDDDILLSMRETLPLISLLTPTMRDNDYFVRYLSVSSAVQGKGVGAKLLEHAFSQAKSLGCKTLQLDVVSENPAVKFYKKMGLKIIAETRIPFLEESYDIGSNLRMIKKIK